MVKFDWKYTEKDEYPPEPGVGKNDWKYKHPSWEEHPWMVYDWWTEVFEVYACKMKGIFRPVPTNLYYVGDNEWMDENGHVYGEGAVIAWDSYTEEE